MRRRWRASDIRDSTSAERCSTLSGRWAAITFIGPGRLAERRALAPASQVPDKTSPHSAREPQATEKNRTVQDESGRHRRLQRGGTEPPFTPRSTKAIECKWCVDEHCRQQTGTVAVKNDRGTDQMGEDVDTDGGFESQEQPECSAGLR